MRLFIFVMVCVSLLAVGCNSSDGGSGGNDKVVIGMDNDADGTNEYTLTFVYNSNNQIKRVVDKDLETGEVELTITYSYDANGDFRSAEIDEDGDDAVDVEIEYTYDADGNWNSCGYDTDNNGVLDDDCMTFEYDTDGRLVRKEEDEDCDGSYDKYYLYTWNAYDNLERVEEHYVGGPVDVSTYAYDSNQNILSISEDEDNDGSIDDVNRYVWNADALGTENFTNHEIYADGGLIRPDILIELYHMIRNLSSMEYDWDNDGSIDIMMYFYYDAVGNLVRYESDENDNGTTDSIGHITWPDNF